MFEGFHEDLEQDLRALHARLRARPPAEDTVEIDRRVRATGNLAAAARKVVQLEAAVLAAEREADDPRKESEDGMRERLDDPDVMERKHREIDAHLARLRQHLDGDAETDAPEPGRTGGVPQQLANMRQHHAA